MSNAHSGGVTVLVTGGAGFIGSHTVDRLIVAGCHVIVIDDFSTGRRENLAQWKDDPRLEVIETDVSDGLFASLTGVLARHGQVHRIIHFAAQTAVMQSISNPFGDIRNNYIGTVQVLEFARCCNVEKVIFASSAAVYGDVRELPVHENAALRPLSPYGIDKLGSEYFLSYYADVHGLPYTAFRFFNVYGPRQDPASPYSGVISIFGVRALIGEPLIIFGDGSQTRDFVYVGDVADLVAKASLSDVCDKTVINVGTGQETAVLKLANTITSSARSGSNITLAPSRAGDIYRSVADVSRLHEYFGAIDHKPLTEGLNQTLAWLREQHN